MVISTTKGPVALVILDGFGYRVQHHGNAIAAAQKPNFDTLWNTYPHAILAASGPAVGLPPGVMGNSEAGHLTIGAGRSIEQDSTRINKAIADGSQKNSELLKTKLLQLAASPLALSTRVKRGCIEGCSEKKLHFLGLLSDANVHSDLHHLFVLLDIAKHYGIEKIIVHPFLDGRDVPPKSAAQYLEQLQNYFAEHNIGEFGSLHGRFYAMDRDKNWDRTKLSYDVLTQPQDHIFDSWQSVLDYYYAQKITDEFIPPTQLNRTNIIESGDGVIFFNFRPDRARQLTAAFTQRPFSHFLTQSLNLNFFITMTDYGIPKSSALPLFAQQKVSNTLKEYLSQAHKTIFSIAETEKYAHVTYFFDGGREVQFPEETRVLIPSLHPKNYVQYPEMSAAKITQAVLNSLSKRSCDFYLINYANADMVGHSGNFSATVRAIEFLDEQLGKLYNAFVIERNGTLIITGDHGKAEEMADESSGQPRTAHTTNPVPFILVQKNLQNTTKLPTNITKLSDIAPLILSLMHLSIPPEMQKISEQ
jgi:2,3-bisphosphoglycerate-independent phosphoglycerate mutase